MATQGMITITQDSRVVMKIITGHDGYKVEEVARAIRDLRTVPTLEEAYDTAFKRNFGSTRSLVVLKKDGFLFKGDDDLDPRYFETFDQPQFNPRWKLGTVDYYELIEL